MPRIFQHARGVTSGMFVLCALLGLPVASIVLAWWQPQWSLWQHLIDTVLWDYILNSLLIGFGAASLAGVIGVSSAWFIARYEFTGRLWWQWLLLLPMAVPAYIIAYTYTGLLDFAGPLQTWLRDSTGWGYGDYWFPEIRSLGGALLMLALVLYPYVYLLTRVAFLQQSQSLEEASRLMGLNRRSYFWKIALPLARPAIVTGCALVMMEALADYGTVAYFGVSTFTTGVFRTWFGMNNALAASQLASMLLAFVLVLIYLEKHSRKAQHYFQLGYNQRKVQRRRCNPRVNAAIVGYFGLVLVLSFMVPVGQLIAWVIESDWQAWQQEFWRLALNSLSLALGAALLIMTTSVFIGYGVRLAPNALNRSLSALAGSGYAIPGAVLAVGLMLPLAAFDKGFNGFTQAWFDWRPGLLLSGTLFALLFAYLIRFLAVGKNAVETGLGRITPSMDSASRTLGNSPVQTLIRVHLPMLKASMLTGGILVFVDVLKELPATLILRPFNFNTLAVKTFELASDERLALAALPALFIVVVGLLPVALLARALEKS